MEPAVAIPVIYRDSNGDAFWQAMSRRIRAVKKEHEMVRVEMVFVSGAIEGKAQKITFIATRFLVDPVLSESIEPNGFYR